MAWLTQHYATLGLESTADDIEVRAVYRRLALAHHPDKVGEQGAAQFAAIATAYKAISEGRKRKTKLYKAVPERTWDEVRAEKDEEAARRAASQHLLSTEAERMRRLREEQDWQTLDSFDDADAHAAKQRARGVSDAAAGSYFSDKNRRERQQREAARMKVEKREMERAAQRKRHEEAKVRLQARAEERERERKGACLDKVQWRPARCVDEEDKMEEVEPELPGWADSSTLFCDQGPGSPGETTNGLTHSESTTDTSDAVAATTSGAPQHDGQVIIRLQADLAAMQATLSSTQEALNIEAHKVISADRQCASLRRQIGEADRKVHQLEAAARDYQALHNEMERTCRAVADTERAEAASRKRCGVLDGLLASVRHEHNKCRAVVAKHNADKVALKGRITTLERDLTDARACHEYFVGVIKEAAHEHTTLQAEFDQVKDTIRLNAEELQTMSDQKAAPFEDKINELARERDEQAVVLQDQITNLQALRVDLRNELKLAHARSADLHWQVEAGLTDNRTKAKDVARLEDEVKRLQIQSKKEAADHRRFRSYAQLGSALGVLVMVVAAVQLFNFR